ncbi:hypothetical protein LA080_014230 [Diaporthe eres]|nr:hypothetical protein LA080_014230 [Diaporthe eres]
MGPDPILWDLRLSTGGTPSTGRPTLHPVLDRGDAATAALSRSGGVVRGQGEGNGDAGNSSPRVSAMSRSALVSGRKYGRRLLA